VLRNAVSSLTVAVIALAVAPALAQMAFQPASPVPVARQPQFFAVGDFNEDGVDDLAVSSPASKTLTILPGGPGGFTTVPTALTFDQQPGAIAVGDLNQDSLADIAALASNGVWVIIGNGDGTFEVPSFVSLKGSSVTALAIGDFDGVRGNDLAIADKRNGLVHICLNDGNGDFSSQEEVLVPPSPGPLVAGDFNLDGAPDLGVLSLQGTGTRNVTVLLGDRVDMTPNFTTTGNFVVGVSAHDMIAADLDNDDVVDMVTANNAYPNLNGQDLTFLLSRGDGSFKGGALQICPFQQGVYRPPCVPKVLAARDLDRNGTTDLAVGVSGADPNPLADALEVFSGSGDGTFVQVAQLGLAGSSPGAIATGDFNGDGRPDIALATLSNNWVQLFAGATLIVNVGSAIARWGVPTQVNVTLTASNKERVASVQNTISFDPSAPIVPDSCVANPIMPDSQFSWFPDGCTLGTCNKMRAVIVNLRNPGVTIPDGSTLYVCSINVQGGAASGKHPLDMSGVVVSDPTGQPLDAAASDGTVVVACVGDCNLDSQVTVDEILKGINIALGNVSLTACSTLDANHDGAVTIDELLAAVAAAVNGCVPPPPSPTPTATLTLTASPTPSMTPTSNPTNSATVTATPTATNTPTPTPPPTDTETPVPTDTATGTPTSTASPTGTATVTPTATASPTDTATVTPTETPTYTLTDRPTPTATPTSTSTATVTDTPTSLPTPTPTESPTPTPIDTATLTPTNTPTFAETATPPPTETPSPTPI
jgi:hypothetical protein